MVTHPFICSLILLLTVTPTNPWIPRVDLAVLIDSSKANNATARWSEVIQLCENLYDAFNICVSSDTKMALITFDYYKATIRLHWDDCCNPTVYKRALANIEQISRNASSANVTIGLDQYNRYLKTDRNDKTNFVLLILRGQIESRWTDEIVKAHSLGNAFIVVDLRTASTVVDNEHKKLKKCMVIPYLNETTVSEVMQLIRLLECEYRPKSDSKCFYENDTRTACRIGIKEYYRPADAYAPNGSCPTIKLVPRNCSIEECESTCNHERPWPGCAEYQCDENITAKRHSPKSGTDQETVHKLQHCLEETTIDCGPCNITPLTPTEVKLILGIPGALLIVSLIVSTIMVVIRLKQQGNASEPKGAKSSEEFSPKPLSLSIRSAKAIVGSS